MSSLAIQLEIMHGSDLHLFAGVKSGAEVNVVEADPGLEIIGLEVANSHHHRMLPKFERFHFS